MAHKDAANRAARAYAAGTWSPSGGRDVAHRVVTVLAPGANPFEFAVACEVFELRRPELGVEWYEHRLAATERPLEVNGGWRVDTPHGLEALDDADTVIVPAGPRQGDVPPDLIEAVRAAHARGARMVSFCSGVYVLAAAGVLDGRPAATHWMYAADLARRHPAIRVDPDVLYVDDGQVLTSAGTAAGIDLALHLVRLDHGAEVANEVARRMVVPPHRDGGQAQFAVVPVPRCPDDDPLGPVLTWMTAHLDEQVTVPQLARLAAMSPRTFARRFREVTGTTPLRWLQHQRVTTAQELLEVTDLPVDAIARRVGFGTAANLREHFRRVTHTSPSAYRDRFRRRGAA
jgi:transcriptional regulator GlxA family with amidase domain